MADDKPKIVTLDLGGGPMDYTPEMLAELMDGIGIEDAEAAARAERANTIIEDVLREIVERTKEEG